MGLSIERNVYSEYAEKLHSIEEELHAQPITEEVREQIIHELDEVHENLAKCEATAAQVNRFAQSFLKELRQKAVFLYGEVDDFYHQHEIDVIQDETESLAQTLEQKDLLKLGRIVDSLKSHIDELLESYSPALSQRRVLVMAKMRMEQAEALMNGQQLPELEISEWTFLETEEIIEEIAEYLGNNERGALRLLMNRLTLTQKRLVMGYLNSQDLLTYLLHDVEGATDNEQIFGG
jgi:molybdopterin converting factor small subunit